MTTTLSEQRLNDYLKEIEELEQRLKLVALVERRNVTHQDHRSTSSSSEKIRRSWQRPPTNTSAALPVQISPIKSPARKRHKRKQQHNKHPDFVASKSLADLQSIITQQQQQHRHNSRTQQQHKTHAAAALTSPTPIGVPDFVTRNRPSTSPPKRRQRRPKSSTDQVTVPQMTQRLEKLSQPGSGSIDYEEFKRNMEKRKHIQDKIMPKEISEQTKSWINKSAVPHRITKPYASEFKSSGFGGAGSRFDTESEFNRTPGPSKYIPESSSLNRSGGRISNANPKSELDLIFLNSPNTPGPSDYGAPELPKSRGVKFGATAMPTELECIMMRAARTPGPNQYQDIMNTSSLSTRGCGKISDANVPGSIAQAINRTKDNPGPSTYSLPSTMIVGGGKFNDANPESYLDKIIRTSKRTPGANAYDLNTNSLSPAGGRISTACPKTTIELAIASTKDNPGPSQYTLPSTMLVGGGKFNEANPESYLDTIIRTSGRTPGANAYQDMMNSSSLSTRGCGKISDANVPGSIEQAINRTKENPGPSKYRVEDVDFNATSGKF